MSGFDSHQLRYIDDIATDLFIDRPLLKPGQTCHKMNLRYAKKRNITDQEITTLISQVKDGRDVDSVAKEAIKICKLHNSLYISQFHSHFKRYLFLHTANPGCEVFVTDRYTRMLNHIHSSSSSTASTSSRTLNGISTSNSNLKASSSSSSLSTTGGRGTIPTGSVHLAVRATKRWKKNEVIPLKGYLTALSQDENEKITNRTDFLSIVHDKTKPKNFRNQLFLGPARFVNHDCNPNVSLGKYEMKAGSKWTLSFKVLRDISPNEEILSSYGENYFDDNNTKCLCRTCEHNGLGAFADPSKIVITNDGPLRRMGIKTITRNGRRLRALARRNSSGSDLTSLSASESESELTSVSDPERDEKRTAVMTRRGRGRSGTSETKGGEVQAQGQDNPGASAGGATMAKAAKWVTEFVRGTMKAEGQSEARLERMTRRKALMDSRDGEGQGGNAVSGRKRKRKSVDADGDDDGEVEGREGKINGRKKMRVGYQYQKKATVPKIHSPLRSSTTSSSMTMTFGAGDLARDLTPTDLSSSLTSVSEEAMETKDTTPTQRSELPFRENKRKSLHEGLTIPLNMDTISWPIREPSSTSITPQITTNTSLTSTIQISSFYQTSLPEFKNFFAMPMPKPLRLIAGLGSTKALRQRQRQEKRVGTPLTWRSESGTGMMGDASIDVSVGGGEMNERGGDPLSETSEMESTTSSSAQSRQSMSLWHVPPGFKAIVPEGQTPSLQVDESVQVVPKAENKGEDEEMSTLTSLVDEEEGEKTKRKEREKVPLSSSLPLPWKKNHRGFSPLSRHGSISPPRSVTSDRFSDVAPCSPIPSPRMEMALSRFEGRVHASKRVLVLGSEVKEIKLSESVLSQEAKVLLRKARSVGGSTSFEG